MNKSIAALLSVVMIAGMVFAQDTTKTAETKQPASADAPAAPMLPVPESAKVQLPPLPEVVATVGDQKILGAKIEKMISKLPPTVPASVQITMRQKALGMLLVQALLENYIVKNDIKPTKEDVEAIDKELAESAQRQNMSVEELKKLAEITPKTLEIQAAARHLSEEAISKEKVDALVKAHPDYFNGTEVQASHILVACAPMAQTKDAMAAYDKIKKVREDIVAGKIKFDEAANKFSDCPSGTRKGEDGKSEYGDLGYFAFSKDGKMMMDPMFSVAAFNTKVGDISNIVRTRFGFHIIKVTNRKDANEKFDMKQAEDIAKMVLGYELQNTIFNQTIEGCDLTIDMAAFTMPEPAVEPAPAPAPAAEPASKK